PGIRPRGQADPRTSDQSAPSRYSIPFQSRPDPRVELRRPRRGQPLIRSRGQSALYAVLLMPTLILILALAVDMAGLQMQKLRLRYAVDLATVTATTLVDAPYYSRTGRLQLEPASATATVRESLVPNLP